MRIESIKYRGCLAMAEAELVRTLYRVSKAGEWQRCLKTRMVYYYDTKIGNERKVNRYLSKLENQSIKDCIFYCFGGSTLEHSLRVALYLQYKRNGIIK